MQQFCVWLLLRTLTTWHCPHSHAGRAAVDRYISCTAGSQQQAAAATVSAGQTDRGRTPDTCIDAAAHAAHGGSAGAVHIGCLFRFKKILSIIKGLGANPPPPKKKPGKNTHYPSPTLGLP